MKIAILQFSPMLAQSARNFSLAESLLMRAERSSSSSENDHDHDQQQHHHHPLLEDLDLLVLPELAFTGYNFLSLEAIAPFLEPTAAGPSTRWAARTARRLKCTVAVGYPEAPGAGGGQMRDGKDSGRDEGVVEGQEEQESEEGEDGNYNTNFDAKISTGGRKGFNSLVFVDSKGDIVAHYRKKFLYYTDESWAEEGGKDGFYAGVVPLGDNGGIGSKKVKLAAGICMDVNPYKFQAAWTEYEFGNHVRETKARLVVVSMAWLTRLEREEVFAEQWRMIPDMDTVGYWVERLRPLIGPLGLEEEVVVVFANRTGDEGLAERVGEVRYAGSSCVMGLRRGDGKTDGEVRIWDIMGRSQEGIMVVDTNKPPRYRVTQKMPAWNSMEDEPTETDGSDFVLGGAVNKEEADIV